MANIVNNNSRNLALALYSIQKGKITNKKIINEIIQVISPYIDSGMSENWLKTSLCIFQKCYEMQNRYKYTFVYI